MTPSDDPFDARPTGELLATDALLDRVGARAPTPDDLDDPLIAALALMAAEIDLDAVPVEETRAGVASAVPELAPPAAPEALAHEENTALVIDLRDTAARRGPQRNELHPPQRRPRSPERQPERTGPPAAMAPPRSLPRMPPPGGAADRPGGPPAGGASARCGRWSPSPWPFWRSCSARASAAALTGGRSVNPLDGLQQVVADLTHGRTQDQLRVYEDVKRHLDAAQKAAEAGEDDSARAELAKVSKPVLQRLTDEDRASALKRVAEVEKVLER